MEISGNIKEYNIHDYLFFNVRTFERLFDFVDSK